LRTHPRNEYDLDVDILINLFEKATQYKRPKDLDRGISYSSANYDNFAIMFQELFIYTMKLFKVNNSIKICKKRYK